MANWLEVGTTAPDFTLPDHDGNDVKLSDLRGKTVVLYFYPKDDTPGCTTEACSFRDLTPDYEEKDAVILGVSADDQASHTRFRTKYKLPFTLLSDEDFTVADQYGASKEKMGGRKGMARSTYVINPDGVITHVYPETKASTIAQDILEKLGA